MYYYDVTDANNLRYTVAAHWFRREGDYFVFCRRKWFIFSEEVFAFFQPKHILRKVRVGELGNFALDNGT